MKVVFTMVVITCMQAALVGQAQEARVTLNMENASLGEVLTAIESKTSYKFVYANNFFPSDKPVSVNAANVPVRDILHRIFSNTGFTFRRSDDLIIISNSNLRKIVTGTVTSESGNPLAGVTVSSADAEAQTATDANGEYTIEAFHTDRLTFSSVAFIPQTVEVNGNSEVDVRLQEAIQDLSEVVMIGFGQRKKQDVTAALSVLSSRQIELSQALSPEIGMQGQMAGVSVVTGGSNPTARHQVRVRGVGTFSGNGAADPLYIIDGIPIVEGGAGATLDKTNDPTRRGPINLYTMINPNDIESIVVLKDAAAAIYGVRAANGVVLITTKSGKKGPVRLDVNAVFGIQRITRRHHVLNTHQYTHFYTGAYNANPDIRNNETVPIHEAAQFGPLWNPDDPRFFGGDPTYDWQSAIIHKASKVQNYNLRASGESDHVSYSFSMGYSGNEGPFTGYTTGRYSLAANVVTRIGKFVEAGINLRGVQQNTDNTPASAAGLSMDVWRAPPWQKIRDASGPLGYAPLWQLNAPLTPETFDKSTLYAQQYVAYRNVFGLIETSENLVQNQTALGSVFLQVSPVKGLNIRGTISGQQTSIQVKSWLGFDRWWFEENPFNPYTNVVNAVAGTRPGIAGIANSATNSVLRSLNADYRLNINDHHVNITLDASQQNYKWTGNGVSRSVVNEDPSLRYFSATGNELGYYEMRANYALIGYMGRVSYNYNNRFYIDVVMRRDGSSRFAPGRQWGTFPSAMFAWRISKEKFLNNAAFINDLKLRAGTGVLGNEQTTGGWSYLAISNVVRPSYNLGIPQAVNGGIAFSSFPNSDLTWERLRTSNIGFDALLFNNHFSITADYYYKVTNGIIQNVELSPSSGITTNADINIAEVMNTGIEFQLGYQKMFGKVGLNITGNFTTVRNKVLKLANHTALRSAGLEEGLPIGFLYGYKVDGIFQSEKEVEQWNHSHHDIISKEQKPGDIYFQDLYGNPVPGSTARNPNKDSVINENDRTYLGQTIAGYYYGFTAMAVYKDFDVSVFFQGVGDIQKYNEARALGENMDDFGRNQLTSVLDAWTEQNKSTSMPRAVYNDPNGNNRISNRFVEDAGYIRLQNLQVGYTIPKRIIEKNEIMKSVRVFASVINLFTITKYSGLDPEDDNYPATRQFLFGIKATF